MHLHIHRKASNGEKKTDPVKLWTLDCGIVIPILIYARNSNTVVIQILWLIQLMERNSIIAILLDPTLRKVATLNYFWWIQLNENRSVLV